MVQPHFKASGLLFLWRRRLDRTPITRAGLDAVLHPEARLRGGGTASMTEAGVVRCSLRGWACGAVGMTVSLSTYTRPRGCTNCEEYIGQPFVVPFCWTLALMALSALALRSPRLPPEAPLAMLPVGNR